MPVMTVSEARKDLFGLIDDVAAVLLSMEDWNAIQETL